MKEEVLVAGSDGEMQVSTPNTTDRTVPEVFFTADRQPPSTVTITPFVLFRHCEPIS